MSARAVVKSAVEHILVSSGLSTVHRRRMSGKVLVLAYHNVVPDDAPADGDLPSHLPLSKFVAQVTSLQATHDVVPLAEVLTPARSARPRAAITFDDAYHGAISNAIPELVRLGLPATVFVAPAFVGGRSFWWDALALPGGRGLDPALRARALDDLRGEDGTIREWARRNGHEARAVPAALCVASERDIVAAAAQPGITLGSHTWGHANLTRLEPSELKEELSSPMEWLRQRVPSAMPWIAYPYGLFNPVVQRAAAEAGYVAGLAVSGGWLTSSPSDTFALPRFNVPRGLSQRGFVIRADGLMAS